MLFDKDDDTLKSFCEELLEQEFVSYSWHMRWDSLFDDLEAQLAEQNRAQLRDEIAENTRIERATAELGESLLRFRGQEISVNLVGRTEIRALLGPCATDYFCLESESNQWIVRYQSVESIALPIAPGSSSSESKQGKAIRFSAVIRALLRDRARCHIHGLQGQVLAEGTLTQVGKDFLVIAVHQRDEYVHSNGRKPQLLIPLGSVGWIVSRALN